MGRQEVFKREHAVQRGCNKAFLAPFFYSFTCSGGMYSAPMEGAISPLYGLRGFCRDVYWCDAYKRSAALAVNTLGWRPNRRDADKHTGALIALDTSVWRRVKNIRVPGRNTRTSPASILK